MASMLGSGRPDAVDHAEGAPYCEACKHFHQPTNKCKACGHQGRLIAYPGPDDPRPPPPYFYTKEFDAQTQPQDQILGYFALIRILRAKVFVHELKVVAGDADWNPEVENQSRHVLGLIGDAPVSYARYRFVPASLLDAPGTGAPPSPAGAFAAVVDRLLVLPTYRQRGYGKETLGVALRDAVTVATANGVSPTKAVLFLPADGKFTPAAKTAIKWSMAAEKEARSADPLALWPAGVPIYAFAVDFPLLVQGLAHYAAQQRAQQQQMLLLQEQQHAQAQAAAAAAAATSTPLPPAGMAIHT